MAIILLSVPNLVTHPASGFTYTCRVSVFGCRYLQQAAES